MLKSKRITLTLLIFFMVSVFCGTGIAPVGAATIPSDIAGSWAFRQISDQAVTLEVGLESTSPTLDAAHVHIIPEFLAAPRLSHIIGDFHFHSHPKFAGNEAGRFQGKMAGPMEWLPKSVR
mgnify:CR=1 FL=1